MKKYALEYGETPQMIFSLLQSLPAIDGTELSVGTAQFSKGMQTSASPDGITIHEKHHKVVFILEGNVDIVADGQTHRAQAGEMLVVPAGEPHSGTVTEDMKLLFVLYGDDEIPSFERK